MVARPSILDRLSRLREALGMSYPDLARLSGVSEPTVKRIFGGRLGQASFDTVRRVAQALGAELELHEQDPEELRRRQARAKAERIAGLVQGTSALESQAVDAQTYKRLVDRSYHELLAGSRRKLWSE